MEKIGLFLTPLSKKISKNNITGVSLDSLSSVAYSDYIDNEKSDYYSKNGYSKAWLHHRGRNKHHYEYWYDNFDRGGHAHIMPFKESVEMFCDYMAAGRVYQGKDFSFKAA